MKYRVTLALISLLACAACTDQPSKSASLAEGSRQFSGVQWDEIAAAQQAAHVTNERLILSR